MKAVAYCRVSSERQAEKDLSIPAQIKAIKEYASRNGYEVIREFVDEAETGRSAERPAFTEMIALAKVKHPPFDTILTWKFSRFARNRTDSVVYKSLLRRRGIRVISINEPVEDTPSGRMFEGMIEVMDEFYSADLALNVTWGMKEVAKRGYHYGCRPPYGYSIVKVKEGEADRSTLHPDDTEVPVVRRVFTEAAAGRGCKSIAKRLNNDGLRTRTGKRWTTNGVLLILRNETYVGVQVWGRRKGNEKIRVEASWPAIVNRATFDKVQSLVTDRAPNVIHPRRVNSPYLLSGLVRCGICNRAMVGRSAKSGQYFYYRCDAANKSGDDKCPGHWIPRSKIEGFVIDRIRNHILTNENLAELVRLTHEEMHAGAQAEKDRLEHLMKQIANADSRLERLYEALETGSFASEELAPRIRQLQARKRELEEERNTTDAALHLRVAELPDIETIKAYVEDLKSVLASSEILEQRAFLKSFVKEIEVGNSELTIRYTLPLPPEGTDEEVIGVLPFTRQSRPCGARTHDTLIKSQVLCLLGLRHLP